jgi:hypothetical protein
MGVQAAANAAFNAFLGVQRHNGNLERQLAANKAYDNSFEAFIQDSDDEEKLENERKLQIAAMQNAIRQAEELFTANQRNSTNLQARLQAIEDNLPT